MFPPHGPTGSTNVSVTAVCLSLPANPLALPALPWLSLPLPLHGSGAEHSVP